MIITVIIILKDILFYYMKHILQLLQCIRVTSMAALILVIVILGAALALPYQRQG